MNSLAWNIAAPAIGAAFLASLVEVVEAFTIVLAVGILRGWKPAALGTAAALIVLALVRSGPARLNNSALLLSEIIGVKQPAFVQTARLPSTPHQEWLGHVPDEVDLHCRTASIEQSHSVQHARCHRL